MAIQPPFDNCLCLLAILCTATHRAMVACQFWSSKYSPAGTDLRRLRPAGADLCLWRSAMSRRDTCLVRLNPAGPCAERMRRAESKPSSLTTANPQANSRARASPGCYACSSVSLAASLHCIHRRGENAGSKDGSGTHHAPRAASGGEPTSSGTRDAAGFHEVF